MVARGQLYRDGVPDGSHGCRVVRTGTSYAMSTSYLPLPRTGHWGWPRWLHTPPSVARRASGGDLIRYPHKTLKFPEERVFPVTTTHLDDVDLGCIQLGISAVNRSIDAFTAMTKALQKLTDGHLLLRDKDVAWNSKYRICVLPYMCLATALEEWPYV